MSIGKLIFVCGKMGIDETILSNKKSTIRKPNGALRSILIFVSYACLRRRIPIKPRIAPPNIHTAAGSGTCGSTSPS